ncbi:MAG: rhomboid family intramembrane serine protease [Phycisphaerae bacterium]
MRLLHRFNDTAAAERFSDYLVTLNIANHLESPDGETEASAPTVADLWIEDDDRLDTARVELGKFQAEPGHGRYVQAQANAARLRSLEQKQAEKRRRNFKDVRTSWSGAGFGSPVTISLIGICALVYLAQQAGQQDAIIERWFFFDAGEDARPFGAILSGEVWRLLTPILMHGGVLHLLFNMYWLWFLGGQIENRRGTGIFLSLLLGSALVSNVGQYVWAGFTDDWGFITAGFFLGMSGVNYALLGYAWMKQKYQPHLGLQLGPHTVLVMMVWLVACMAGLIGNVANGAHVVGLLVGLGVGVAPVYVRKLRKQLS